MCRTCASVAVAYNKKRGVSTQCSRCQEASYPSPLGSAFTIGYPRPAPGLLPGEVFRAHDARRR